MSDFEFNDYAKIYGTIPATDNDIQTLNDICKLNNISNDVLIQALSISNYDYLSSIRYLDFIIANRDNVKYCNRKMGSQPPVAV